MYDIEQYIKEHNISNTNQDPDLFIDRNSKVYKRAMKNAKEIPSYYPTIKIIRNNSTYIAEPQTVNTNLACYGSTTTSSNSGWGSFPSCDTATFGGSGTEGAMSS